MRSKPKDLNIAGKDYLNEKEACHYCCVSQTKFREDIMSLVPQINLFGRKVYRRCDLSKFIESAPEWRKGQ